MQTANACEVTVMVADSSGTAALSPAPHMPLTVTISVIAVDEKPMFSGGMRQQ